MTDAGVTYYFNAADGSSSWELPPGVTLDAPPPAPPAPPPALFSLASLTDSSLSSLFQLGIGAGACIVLLVLAARACCSGGEEARAGRKPPRRMRLADDEGEGSEVASSMTYSAVSKVQDS